MSRSFNKSLSDAFRNQLNITHGGSRRSLGTAEMATKSLANELIAPSNNAPGREFLRRGYGNNIANAAAQNWMNSLFRKR